ncbi:jouberin-like [Acipenser ruthenus]|uniref:jouberin-like n=1 Tax=Acipenser ruthenus TaxID=7906 RepID=UPI002741D2D4|nr:jouberin-like [Acipenser ruthenus]
MLTTFSDFLQDCGESVDCNDLKVLIVEHVTGLKQQFRDIFQEDGSSLVWVRDPFVTSVRSNLSLPAPSLLSLHSKLRLPSTLGARLIPQQSSHNVLKYFQGIANPSASFLRVEADTFTPVQQTVVALYDYTANRSDELTIHRGEIIQVLYKDNDNWWFGRLANGQQGYFPANYVADERGFEDELCHTLEPNPGQPDQQHEVEERSPTPTKISAVISKSGKFKIISENDTDTDSPVTLVKKKKKKKKAAVGSGSDAPVLAPEPL